MTTRTAPLFVVVLTIALAAAGNAEARNVEPGEIRFNGGLGAGLKLGSRIGGSSGYMLFTGQAEYSIDSQLSAIGDLTFGLALNTWPVRTALGARYRLTNLELPISPYAQAEVVFTRLIDVIGANLWAVGVRGAGGLDYFLTRQLGVGAQLGIDMTRTMPGEGYGAFYGTVDFLLYASYAL